jgi:hypothetical protein
LCLFFVVRFYRKYRDFSCICSIRAHTGFHV